MIDIPKTLLLRHPIDIDFVQDNQLIVVLGILTKLSMLISHRIQWVY